MKREPAGEESPVATFEWAGSASPTGAAVDAVAAVSDTRPTELPPLHRSVDSDGLNALLDHMRDRGTEGLVEFEYCDRRMVLTADGRGRVYESDGTT